MKRFLVTVFYAEPTHAAHRGIAPRPYRGSFEVDARDPASAMARARGLFAQAQARSGVGWVRTILWLRCEPIPA